MEVRNQQRDSKVGSPNNSRNKKQQLFLKNNLLILLLSMIALSSNIIQGQVQDNKALKGQSMYGITIDDQFDEGANVDPESVDPNAMDDAGSSLSAEPEHKSKFIYDHPIELPDSFEDKSLPPMIREAKKKLKLERDEKIESSWDPENRESDIEDQKQDVVQKSEKIERDEEYEANKDTRNPTIYKDYPVDMIDVSQELKIGLMDVDSKIKASDPIQLKKQKWQIQHLLNSNANEKTLIDREKYDDFIQEQLRARQIASEQGNLFNQPEDRRSIPRIIFDVLLRGIFALVLLVLISVSMYYAFNYCVERNRRRKMLNRGAELSHIRKHQNVNDILKLRDEKGSSQRYNEQYQTDVSESINYNKPYQYAQQIDEEDFEEQKVEQRPQEQEASMTSWEIRKIQRKQEQDYIDQYMQIESLNVGAGNKRSKSPRKEGRDQQRKPTPDRDQRKSSPRKDRKQSQERNQKKSWQDIADQNNRRQQRRNNNQ